MDSFLDDFNPYVHYDELSQEERDAAEDDARESACDFALEEAVGLHG